MISINNKTLFTGITIFCALVLLIAYFIEYVLNHAPCNLCLIERIPYMVSFTLAFLVLILNKYERISLIVIGLFFVFGTIISFYHIGIEQGIFNESLVCFLETENKAISAEDLLKELKTKSVSCKDVVFRIFGLSLATLNTIISFVISVIMILTSINYGKN
mgnify:FL=1